MEVQPVSIYDGLKAAFEAQATAIGNPLEPPAERSAIEAVPPGAEQVPAVEQVPKAGVPAEDTQLSPRFAKLRQEQQKIAADKKSWQEQVAKDKDRLARLDAWEKAIERSAVDPMAVVQLTKMAPDQFVKAIMEKGTLSPEYREVLEVKDELRALKEQQAKEREEARSSYEKQQLDNYRKDLQSKLQSDDRFELARQNTGPDLVMDVIRQHYAQQEAAGIAEPKGLSWEQASEYVENYLFEQMKPVLNTKRVQSYFNEIASKASTVPPAKREPGPTLTSSNTTAYAAGTKQTPPAQGNSASEDPVAKVAAELERMLGGRR